MLLSASCIALPPGTYRSDQFAPGTGPDLARAATFQGLGAWWDVFDWSPTFLNGRQTVGLGSVSGCFPRSGERGYFPSSRYCLASANTRSNIGSVSLPVNVFCWLG